jgi:antitoxin VapB
MAEKTNARIFWSGGSQAVRLPKAMRLPGAEVSVVRRGKTLVLSPLEGEDRWGDFWDHLLPLKKPVERWKTKPAEKRRPL